MKHKKILILGLVLAAAILTATTGVVIARGIQHGSSPFTSDSEVDTSENGYWGPMHGMGWRRDADEDSPPMRDAMVQALADETGLSEEEILSRFEEGEHFYDIALESGLTEEDFFELMNSVREEVFSEEFDGWRHMQRIERYPEQAEDEGYSLPCHRYDEAGAPAYGYPSRGRGRGW